MLKPVCVAIGLAALLSLPDVALAEDYAQGTGGGPLAKNTPASATLQAEASVDLSTGAATSSYGFDLPTARGAAQPALSLRYNSSDGVGFAGVGWTLSMPSIVRKGASAIPRFVDDVLQSSAFATDLGADEYYVEGQLLVPICFVTSCGGATPRGETFPAQVLGGSWVYFRRQIDDGNRYFLSADGQTWLMETKAGRMLQFGHPLDSLLDDGIEQPDPYTVIQVGGSLAAVYRWNLVRDADSYGNTVYYSWTNVIPSSGDSRSSTIQYLSDIYDTPAVNADINCPINSATCLPSAVGSFAHHVHLTWNIAATGMVPYLTTPIWQAIPFAELTGVDVTSASMESTERALVRRYHLTYEWNPAETRRFLSSVVLEGECAAPIVEDASTGLLPATTGCYALPPTSYTYSPEPGPDALTMLPGSMSGAPTPAGQGYAYLDLNGDGAADFLTGYYQGQSEGGATLVAYFSGDPTPHPLPLSALTPSTLPGGLGAIIPGSTPDGLTTVMGDWVSNGRVNWMWVDPALAGSMYTVDNAPSIVGSQGPSMPTFANVPSWFGGTYGLRGESLDIDGDGLTDIFQVPDYEGNATLSRAYFTTRDRAGQTNPFALQTQTVCPTTDMDPAAYGPGAKAPNYRALADFDGDGLADLVIVELPGSRGAGGAAFDILPNRGDGRFGYAQKTPEPGCDRNAGYSYTWAFTPAASSAYELADFTDQYVNDGIASEGYYVVWQPLLGDVNGDGLADYVALTGAGMDVCLRHGASIDTAAWECHTSAFEGCVPASNQNIQACNVGFNFTVCGRGGCSVDNGTDPSELHGSLADVNGDGVLDIVTEEPVNGGKAYARTLVGGLKPGLLSTVTSSTGATTSLGYESAKDLGLSIPTPTWVVTEVLVSNNLPGAQGLSVENDYSYRDPVYDGREKEFYGFKKVTQKRPASPAGALSEPGKVTTTTFATAACGADVACGAVLQDYAYFHALRGLPATVEESDASGNHLRTTWNEYQWNWNYTGLDNRRVIDDWVALKHVYLWQGQGSVAATVPVVLTAPSGIAPNRGTGEAVSVLLPTSGSELRTGVEHDAFGNVTGVVDYGKYGSDVPIRTALAWGLAAGDTSGWSYRITDEQIGYAAGGGPISGRVREYQATYWPQGTPSTVSEFLSGSMPLASPRAAQVPPNASLEGTWISLATLTYDTFGNLQQMGGPDGRCSGAGYDPIYDQLPTTLLVYPSGCAGSTLAVQRVFDRGLERVKSVTLPNQITAAASYDGLGRIIELDQPSAATTGKTSPASYFTYDDSVPLRSVHTQTVDTNLESPFADHYRFLDAFGDVVARIDQSGTPATGTQWIASGVHTRFASGLVKQQYKESFFSGGTPAALFAQAMTAPSAGFAYDGLGRLLTSTDYAGFKTTRTYYPAELSVNVRDPEQQKGRPHDGAWNTVVVDGRGRTTRTVQYVVHGPQGAGALTTSTAYQATGEPTAILQTSPGNTYSRSMEYDTLGRMVLNAEPNSGTWRYAYDDAGEVVGTSDQRGCGENIYYDALGRTVAEDYSTCDPAQSYSSPNLATGDGTEVFNRYDSVSLWLTDSYSRAEHTCYFRDARGRVQTEARTIAVPGGSPYLSQRYAPNVYARTATYFESNRVETQTTGADASELIGAGSAVGMHYGLEGVLRSVISTYGPIITGQTIDPSGAVTNRTFGDAAGTTAELTYDPNERLATYYLHRTAGPWVSSNSGYSPTDPSTLVGDLTELVIVRDRVGNPGAIEDIVDPTPWMPGAKPPTSLYTYYDDYRLATVSTSYAGGDDPYTSPYAAEIANGNPKYPPAISTPRTRVRTQSFGYDWLGNMVSSTDDKNAFLDRSLGTIANGSLATGPHQMRSAASADGQHSLSVQYDVAGNVTSWSVSQHGASGASVISTYTYQWDEVGRLASASREDPGQGTSVSEEFAYDAGGKRVLTAYESTPRLRGAPAPSYRVEVFPSLVLEDAQFPDAQGDYEHTAATEHVYLGPGGTKLAHVFQSSGGLPSATGSSTHMYLLMTNPDGSTAFVVDQGTGELVERPTYQAYGAAESDFRPTTWGSFREDVRYTGHWDDAEVGLIYHGVRYYAPQLGRWISPDPLAVQALGSDLNVYAFVSGSPIRYSDPIGLDGTPDPDDGGAQPGGPPPPPPPPPPQTDPSSGSGPGDGQSGGIPPCDGASCGSNLGGGAGGWTPSVPAAPPIVPMQGQSGGGGGGIPAAIQAAGAGGTPPAPDPGNLASSIFGVQPEDFGSYVLWSGINVTLTPFAPSVGFLEDLGTTANGAASTDARVWAGFKSILSIIPAFAIEENVAAGVGSNVVRELPWATRTVANAATALEGGATEVNVASRAQAEELFLGRYQVAGYRNTTGWSASEAKNFFGQKAGTYHWDEGAAAFPEAGPHLQIHTFEGDIIRIFFQ